MASIFIKILLDGVQLPHRLSSFLIFNSLKDKPVTLDHFTGGENSKILLRGDSIKFEVIFDTILDIVHKLQNDFYARTVTKTADLF